MLYSWKGWAGFDIGPKEKKMGIRGSDTHSTFQWCAKENRIGADGFGSILPMSVLNGGRIGIASQALGIATVRMSWHWNTLKNVKHLGKKFSNIKP
jgi:alkylation response protein AidB-like acyl-CoA dehydrogenase